MSEVCKMKLTSGSGRLGFDVVETFILFITQSVFPSIQLSGALSRRKPFFFFCLFTGTSPSL